jgi:hypothetical protein
MATPQGSPIARWALTARDAFPTPHIFEVDGFHIPVGTYWTNDEPHVLGTVSLPVGRAVWQSLYLEVDDPVPYGTVVGIQINGAGGYSLDSDPNGAYWLTRPYAGGPGADGTGIGSVGASGEVDPYSKPPKEFELSFSLYAFDYTEFVNPSGPTSIPVTITRARAALLVL